MGRWTEEVAGQCEVRRALRCAAMIVVVASVANSPRVLTAEHAVVACTGVEVVAGAARLGTGTVHRAQDARACLVGQGDVDIDAALDRADGNLRLAFGAITLKESNP